MSPLSHTLLNQIIDALPTSGTELLLRIHRRLFARKQFATFNRTLLELGLRGLGVQGMPITDGWDARRSGELRYLERLLRGKESFTFIDVGARNAEHCRTVKKYLSSARCVAIEPNPLVQETLKTQARRWGFETIEVALGAESGEVTLYDAVNGANGTPRATVFGEIYSHLYGLSTRHWRVPKQTVDELFKRDNWKKIDLIKIDVEGSELEVIHGARDSLSNNLVRRVQFEFSRYHRYRRTFLEDFCDALPGFRFYRLLPDGTLLAKGDPRQLDTDLFLDQNWLAVHPDELEN